MGGRLELLSASSPCPYPTMTFDLVAWRRGSQDPCFKPRTLDLVDEGHWPGPRAFGGRGGLAWVLTGCLTSSCSLHSGSVGQGLCSHSRNPLLASLSSTVASNGCQMSTRVPATCSQRVSPEAASAPGLRTLDSPFLCWCFCCAQRWLLGKQLRQDGDGLASQPLPAPPQLLPWKSGAPWS